MHNKTKNTLRPSHWIMQTINTRTNKVKKIFPSNFDIKQNFIYSAHHFKDIIKHYSNLPMNNLDVNFLITNISMDRSINIFIGNSWNNCKDPSKIT